MTRLWPNGQLIDMRLTPDGVPGSFYWLEAWHVIDRIANRWRVHDTWWSEEAAREFYKVTTEDGLLCVIFKDLLTGRWFLSQLYD